ncbi:hypothetical protein SO802_017763 [Lithocarpus litseifolius]|uniref:Uncharacterized protein n=1 Tax=Lithocarpus litseifolius TaxID=425828 RepID=A0AAW2CNS3_9ROSI
MESPNLKGQGMRETVTTRDSVPGKSNRIEKEFFVNLGTVADVMDAEGVDHANVKVVDSGHKLISPCVLPPLHINADSHTGLEEDLVVSEQAEYQVHGLALDNDTNGPIFSKPKPTWTRINRMDFGLGGLARALTLPSVGKRDTCTNSSAQDEDYQSKKGRVEDRSNVEGSDTEISAGVDSHPCRKQ